MFLFLRAAVNVVDFDDKYIVSASGDRTIKVGQEVFEELFIDPLVVRCGPPAPVSL